MDTAKDPRERMRSNMRASCARPVVAAGAVDPAAHSPLSAPGCTRLNHKCGISIESISIRAYVYIGGSGHAFELLRAFPKNIKNVNIYVIRMHILQHGLSSCKTRPSQFCGRSQNHVWIAQLMPALNSPIENSHGYSHRGTP